MITPEEVRERFDYDPETGLFKCKRYYKGCRTKDWFPGCLDKTNGYMVLGFRGKTWGAHRVAWLWYYGEWPFLLDHVNGVRSDNRICNLRLATNAQNSQNRGLGSQSSSGLIGARKRGNRWQSSISINGKRKWLGTFLTAEEAHEAYKRAASEHYGEFFRV